MLARGPFTNSFRAQADLKYKALLPINDIPMVDYVLHALQQSVSEKIFIVQGVDEGLETAVRSHHKNVFINCSADGSSFSSSLFSGLAKLAENYSQDELSRTDIMLVPCDIPLVSSSNFDRLIAENSLKGSDVCVSMIHAGRLKEKYPGRDFRGIYYHDLGYLYCIQNFAFISGDTLNWAYHGGTRKNYDSRYVLPDNIMRDVIATADYFVASREKRCQILLILWEYLRRLITRGYIRESLLSLSKLLNKRYTTVDGRRFLFLASGLMGDYIESEEAELSFDVDKPEHLEAVLKFKSCNYVAREADDRTAVRY